MYSDNEKGKELPSVDTKYAMTSGSTAWSVHSSPDSHRSSQFRHATPLAFAETVEPAFEEREEQLPDSKVTLRFDNAKLV